MENNKYIIPKETDNNFKFIAKLYAMEIRNQLEDFHIKNISEKDMKELNTIIRDSIYSMMKVIMFSSSDKIAMNHIVGLASYIPEYWEEPKDIIKMENKNE